MNTAITSAGAHSANAPSATSPASHLTNAARTLRRTIVAAMGISARMGAEL
ncbi:hypothetical protein [Catenulispora subtropica]|uniref:hypothetical protein n=1 Tax=Catenulispora subtropica TaxID=450798 RepID=UPI0031D87AC4